MKRILIAPLLLIVVLMFSSIGSVRALGEPSLPEIFYNLGFTNLVESNLQTFVPGTYNATLYAEFADYYNQNELSWYKRGTDLYGVIFYGPDGNFGYVNPPLKKSFTVDSEFGLSLISPVARYFTETAKNLDHAKHAVVYENLDDPGMYLIGWENGCGDFDYNDMVLSIKLFRPKTINVNGLDWYHMTYNRDRIVLVLFGGYAHLYTSVIPSYVTVNPLFCPQEYSKPKMRFALDLIANGFDILTNTGTPNVSPSYSGVENWVKDAAEWTRNQGYKDVYLFGLSAGAVVVAYEIQREHATMDFSAAAFASGPVDWSPYFGAVIHSAQTASNDKVSTCFIEGVDDGFYSQMKLYYNNTMTHKIWYDWLDGHDVFPNTAKDYPGLTVAEACVNWYNAAHPPNTPKMPSGPSFAIAGLPTSYTTVTIDPNRDSIRYQFDWGDGTSTTGLYSSGTTVCASHSWSSSGRYYNIKVRAQDSNNLWSVWSGYLAVYVSSGGGGGCPFVSTWDGSEYVLDNNILPTSQLGKGSDVEDYYALEQTLVQDHGKYSFLISEFQNEHSYLDQVKLLAVDHESDVNIAVTPDGEILTYKHPFSPVSCVDSSGIDRLSQIRNVDGDFNNPATFFQGYANDYLLLNFGQVRSKNAKLIVRNDMFCADKCILVQVVNASGEWQTVAIIASRAVWATEGVNLSPYLMQGKDLMVRLMWTQPHKLDYVGLDTTKQEDYEIHYANLVSAVHSNEGDVKSQLLESDNTYAELVPGEQIELAFTLPQEAPEARTYILYVEGHYCTIPS